MTDPLNGLLDAVVAGLKAHFGAGLRQCKRHAGRFDAAELERHGADAPAILVAPLGIGPGAEAGDGTADHTLRLGAFVVATDRGRADRDVLAAGLVGTLITHLPGQVWGRDDTHPVEARTLRAQNLYASTRGRGVVLWGLEWRQAIRLGTSNFADWPGTLATVAARGPGDEAVRWGGVDG
ncbi:hypothetical protein [Roseospira visakhapatnamensis]|uniref:Phage gp37-like protein n=1 Tax=Roseospira visakhapatnamensis TaxID=390880 RepID=A0A7W6RFB4_9PROT|nr:hypothetical protein [Roseospira visakhapatnamensis]MBB4266893.1 phage gp37-like protein [Roseospira visakhapatnamensis]